MTRWLVVGAGQAGRCHMAAITKTAEASLTGVVAPELPDINGVPVFPDIPTALAQVEADAAVVATPNDVQAACAIDLLRAGLPVLCEKPAGRTAHDVRQILAVSQETGVPAGIVLNQRAQVHARWIKTQIDTKALQPALITFTGDVTCLSGWHTDPVRSGGGVLRTIAMHYIDLLMWWLGPLTNISLSMSGAPVEDTVHLTANVGGTCKAEIHITATKPVGEGPVQCVVDGGNANLRMVGHAITESKGLDTPPTAEEVDPAFMFGPGHLTVITEATAAMKKGAPFPVPLKDALPLLDGIDELYRSSHVS